MNEVRAKDRRLKYAVKQGKYNQIAAEKAMKYKVCKYSKKREQKETEKTIKARKSVKNERIVSIEKYRRKTKQTQITVKGVILNN